MTLGRRLSLLGKWTRVRLLIYLRTPRAAFFTFIFPLILLLLLNSTSSGQEVTSTASGEQVAFATYFTPSIAIFALITGCYTGTIFAVSTARDRGILKRIAGTPLPAPVFLGCVGDLDDHHRLLLGGPSDRRRDDLLRRRDRSGTDSGGGGHDPRRRPLSQLARPRGRDLRSQGGVGAGRVQPHDVPDPVPIGRVLPDRATRPQWIQTVANIFPVAHLIDAFTACFDPATTGSGFTGDLWNPLIWTAVGLFVATRRFRVEMTAAGGDRRRAATA